MCSLRAHCQTIGMNREENFPTKCAPALEASRLSPAHGEQGRPPDAGESPTSRTHEAIRLIEPLRSRASFAALSKNGRRRHGRWCWVRYAPLPQVTTSVSDGKPAAAAEQELPQIGYAIGRKVGNAVVRNRIRRRLRAIVHAEAPFLPPGIYLIGVKSDQAASISYEMLQQDLRTTLAAAASAGARHD